MATDERWGVDWDALALTLEETVTGVLAVADELAEPEDDAEPDGVGSGESDCLGGRMRRRGSG